MGCHICGREAVSRCYNCGGLFCAAHGDENCARCTTAIKAGDPRQDRISAARLRDGARPGWWRPLPAAEYAPPACHTCHGLARAVCPNCQRRFCAEHAGGGVCADCRASAQVGVYILAAVAAVFLLMMLANTVWRPS